MAINKQKYFKFRESEGFFFSEWYKDNRLLVFCCFSLSALRGVLYFYAVIENLLPKMKILEKIDLVQFGIGNHGSFLISNSLLKRIRAEKEHESSLLKNKERLLVKFKDTTWDCFLQAQNDPVELGWKFRRLFSFCLCSWGESVCYVWGRRPLWEGDSIISCGWCLLPASQSSLMLI